MNCYHVGLMLVRELAQLAHCQLSIKTQHQLALVPDSVMASALGVRSKQHVLAIAEHLLSNDPHLSQFGGVYDIEGSSSTIWSELTFTSPKLKYRIPIRLRNDTDPIQVDVVSRGFDFGAAWFGVPCSVMYLNESDAIFDTMESIHFQRHRGIRKSRRWHDSLELLMDAFAAEVSRITSSGNEQIGLALAKHMLGDEGRYDVVLGQKYGQIMSHNIDGRLMWGRRLKLPTRIIEVSRDGADAPNLNLNIVFDQSWQLQYQPFLWDEVNAATLRMGISLVGRPAARTEYYISRRRTSASSLPATYPTISIV